MTPARKTTVRRVPDGHFRQWHVTYACGCPAHDAPKWNLQVACCGCNASKGAR